MKWYEKGWVIFLLLLFVFPVGVFLLWKCGHWHKIIKVIATVIFAFIFLLVIIPMPEEVDIDISTEVNESAETINKLGTEESVETTPPSAEIPESTPEETPEPIEIPESIPEETPEPVEIIEEEPEPTIQMTELFENVYLPYVRKEKSSIFEGVQTFAENCSYRVEITEPTDEIVGKIKFYDENNNYVYMSFNLDGGLEVIKFINYFHAASNSEVSYYDFGDPKYNTYEVHVIGSEDKKVSGVDDQIKFLFQQ